MRCHGGERPDCSENERSWLDEQLGAEAALGQVARKGPAPRDDSTAREEETNSACAGLHARDLPSELVLTVDVAICVLLADRLRYPKRDETAQNFLTKFLFELATLSI